MRLPETPLPASSSQAKKKVLQSEDDYKAAASVFSGCKDSFLQSLETAVKVFEEQECTHISETKSLLIKYLSGLESVS